VEPIHFIVYSDYLCPWCLNASVRLSRLEEECGDAVRIEWRSYLLRPRPASVRDLEKFRHYTRSWLRPAAESDSGVFRVWEGDAGPPSHSIPPHLVAKAAGQLGDAAFRRMHRRLLEAYFSENRDVTDAETLRALWAEAELPAGEFERTQDPALLQATLQQHTEALEAGATGVPAVRLADDDVVIVGAQPLALYQKWFERVRARREADVGAARAGA
jgi:predicted DsbA family dithiol-disulfide isomerase